MAQTINIYLDRALTPRVWTPEQGTEDSVYETLIQIVEKITHIHEAPGSDFKLGSPDYDALEKQLERQTIGEHNNIIAIDGNRGTGKSSILRSLPNIFPQGNLISSGPNKEEEYFTDIKFNELRKAKFLVLPVTDPSVFKKNDSLIETFVSQLFKIFEYSISKNQNENHRNNSQQPQLVSAFKKVRLALQSARMEASRVLGDKINEPTYTDIQALEHLSAGVSLKHYLIQLIYSFLNWYYGTFDQDGTNGKSLRRYIIICVDDLDLYTGDIMQIIEDLRTIIQLPGVLLVTAARKTQLKEEVECFYSKRHAQRVETPELMAARYIDKIIPYSRTINSISMERESNKISLRKSKIEEINNIALSTNEIISRCLTRTLRIDSFIFRTSSELGISFKEIRPFIEFLYYLEELSITRPQDDRVDLIKNAIVLYASQSMSLEFKEIVEDLYSSNRNFLLNKSIRALFTGFLITHGLIRSIHDTIDKDMMYRFYEMFNPQSKNAPYNQQSWLPELYTIKSVENAAEGNKKVENAINKINREAVQISIWDIIKSSYENNSTTMADSLLILDFINNISNSKELTNLSRLVKTLLSIETFKEMSILHLKQKSNSPNFKSTIEPLYINDLTLKHSNYNDSLALQFYSENENEDMMLKYLSLTGRDVINTNSRNNLLSTRYRGFYYLDREIYTYFPSTILTAPYEYTGSSLWSYSEKLDPKIKTEYNLFVEYCEYIRSRRSTKDIIPLFNIDLIKESFTPNLNAYNYDNYDGHASIWKSFFSNLKEEGYIITHDFIDNVLQNPSSSLNKSISKYLQDQHSDVVLPF